MTDNTHNIDATESRRESERDDPHDAALGILRELGGADKLSWRNECERYGYHFDSDEFREIVEELVADELVRAHYEDPRWAEERHVEEVYMRAGGAVALDNVINDVRESDPNGNIAARYENPPIYEAVDM
jgi:hypothetical protein